MIASEMLSASARSIISIGVPSELLMLPSRNSIGRCDKS